MARDFILWTGVMVPITDCRNKTGSSAIVESYFADLKTRVLRTESTLLAIDEIVAIHL